MRLCSLASEIPSVPPYFLLQVQYTTKTLDFCLVGSHFQAWDLLSVYKWQIVTLLQHWPNFGGPERWLSTCCQAQTPEFYSQDLQGGRREQTSEIRIKRWKCTNNSKDHSPWEKTARSVWEIGCSLPCLAREKPTDVIGHFCSGGSGVSHLKWCQSRGC